MTPVERRVMVERQVTGELKEVNLGAWILVDWISNIKALTEVYLDSDRTSILRKIE